MITLRFCADCGALTTPDATKCPNCNYPIEEKAGRLEGAFSDTDGQRLIEINFGQGFFLED